MIGCDFHPSFQQVAIFDNRTGEIQEKRLQHREEAERFYGSLAGQEVRVGMEACGHYPWFERLLGELGFELKLGDAAKIRAWVVRRQKTDRRDAEHLLDRLRQDHVN
jgi:transposase